VTGAARHPGAGAAGAADPCAPLLEQAQRLCEDHTLADVRAWKAAHPGALAIGHMPIYAPRPLIEALGCLPVGVFGAGAEIDIIRGDSYFQSYLCHIPRSTIELALAGHLDALDGMVFPSICDVIRNLSGMWQMLFPDRWAFYLDLPQNFDDEVGGRFYVDQMRAMARELEERGARPLDAGALRRAIADENARRAALEELDEMRRREPWRVRASEAYRIARAGTRTTAREHRELILAFAEAARRRPARVFDNARVVVVGSFCEQPPLALIQTLERSGCDIVEDDFQLGLRTIEGAVVLRDGADPLEDLARAFLERGVATASRYVGDGSKGAALVGRVRACEADGVIFAAASFCDPALLDQPMLEAALDREGIPHTSLKFAENTGQFQPIREQAGAFSDAVKLWEGQT
jgi:benzoyl-CoA reductase subunit C